MVTESLLTGRCFLCRRYFPWNLILLSIFVSSTSGQHLPSGSKDPLRAGIPGQKWEFHPLIFLCLGWGTMDGRSLKKGSLCVLKNCKK